MRPFPFLVLLATLLAACDTAALDDAPPAPQKTTAHAALAADGSALPAWELDWFYFGDISSLAYDRHPLADDLYDRLLAKNRDELAAMFGPDPRHPNPLIGEIESVAMGARTRLPRFPWRRAALDRLQVRVVSDLQAFKRSPWEMLLTPDALYLSWEDIAAGSPALRDKVERELGIAVPALGDLPDGMHLWVEAAFATADPMAEHRLFSESGHHFSELRQAAESRGRIGAFRVDVTPKRRDRTGVAHEADVLTFGIGIGANTRGGEPAQKSRFERWPDGAVGGGGP